MLDVYYHPFSFPALGVVFTAEALGLSYERKIVDLMNGEQQGEAFQAINPFGRVPAIKDGDFCLSESQAIARYLSAKAGYKLYAEEVEVRAKIDEWMDFILNHIRTPMGRVQFNRTIAPMMGQEPDEKSIAFGEHVLASNLPHIEAVLSQQDYLCGDALTLADISLVATLEPADMAKIDLTPFPALVAWLKTQRGTPWYTAVHSHFGAELGL